MRQYKRNAPKRLIAIHGHFLSSLKASCSFDFLSRSPREKTFFDFYFCFFSVSLEMYPNVSCELNILIFEWFWDYFWWFRVNPTSSRLTVTTRTSRSRRCTECRLNRRCKAIRRILTGVSNSSHRPVIRLRINFIPNQASLRWAKARRKCIRASLKCIKASRRRTINKCRWRCLMASPNRTTARCRCSSLSCLQCRISQLWVRISDRESSEKFCFDDLEMKLATFILSSRICSRNFFNTFF